jgi:PTH2 family peptidyl-tRNA hydrolase
MNDAGSLDKMKMVIVVRRDLKMRRGKEIAQAGHGVLGALQDSVRRWEIEDSSFENMEFWRHKCGQKKITLKSHSEDELVALAEKAEAANLGHYLVRDAGKTEVAPNTATVLVIGPGHESKIDEITGHLEIY